MSTLTLRTMHGVLYPTSTKQFGAGPRACAVRQCTASRRETPTAMTRTGRANGKTPATRLFPRPPYYFAPASCVSYATMPTTATTTATKAAAARTVPEHPTDPLPEKEFVKKLTKRLYKMTPRVYLYPRNKNNNNSNSNNKDIADEWHGTRAGQPVLVKVNRTTCRITIVDLTTTTCNTDTATSNNTSSSSTHSTATTRDHEAKSAQIPNTTETNCNTTTSTSSSTCSNVTIDNSNNTFIANNTNNHSNNNSSSNAQNQTTNNNNNSNA